MVEEIVEKLELYSEFLELDGQDGKSHAYNKAARAIKVRDGRAKRGHTDGPRHRARYCREDSGIHRNT